MGRVSIPKASPEKYPGKLLDGPLYQCHTPEQNQPIGIRHCSSTSTQEVPLSLFARFLMFADIDFSDSRFLSLETDFTSQLLVLRIGCQLVSDCDIVSMQGL